MNENIWINTDGGSADGGVVTMIGNIHFLLTMGQHLANPLTYFFLSNPHYNFVSSYDHTPST